MSAILSTHEAHAFHHASDIPPEVWVALRENEAAANVVLPFAEKAKRFPHGGDRDQLWIALYDNAKNVTFVLSCTKGPLGNYPIFIVAPKAPSLGDQSDEDLTNSLTLLVRCLLDEVPAQRVFSLFSIMRVTEQFAKVFVDEAQARQQREIKAHRDPYYDTTFTFCSRDTFNEFLPLAFPLRDSEDIVVALRRANVTHLDELKVLCKAFSDTSPPFILDDAGAELEARLLIENQQAWVHLVQDGDQEPQIACLVATTRESDNVMGVTKVFTPERWRGRGCAARLLHRVCQDALKRKTRVVLYVGNSAELAPARKVYRKIGFQGLDEPRGLQVLEGVERWLEVGFEGTTLGHW